MSWEDKWKCAICGNEATVAILCVKFCNSHVMQREGYQPKDKKYQEFERKKK